MQLIAARLQRTPTAIIPHTCKTGEVGELTPA
jgi:hypothetical protein